MGWLWGILHRPKQHLIVSITSAIKARDDHSCTESGPDGNSGEEHQEFGEEHQELLSSTLVNLPLGAAVVIGQVHSACVFVFV